MIFAFTFLILNNFDPFFQKVASDFNAHSNYLVLCLDNQKIAIENDNLFTYLNRCENVSRRNYVKKVCKILKYNRCMVSGEICNEKDGFNIVQYNEQVENNANLGKDEFIKIYFINMVLKKEVNKDEKFAIIAQLFEWQISCYQDDESGLLMIKND